MMIKVVIVDDHAILRKGLHQIIAESEDMEVVGEADSSAAAMGYIRHAPERCVWGSDWPHPDATSGRVPMPDDVVLINLLTDIAYALADPRVKLS